MTKEQFTMRLAARTGENYIVQAIKLDNDDIEIQVTPFSNEKIGYIEMTYDEEMRHKRNPKIAIVDCMVV